MFRAVKGALTKLLFDLNYMAYYSLLKLNAHCSLLTAHYSPLQARDLFSDLIRVPMKPDAASLSFAHKTLMEMGALANEAGRTQAALRSFEAAYRLQPDDGISILSAANMRLKLGQVTRDCLPPQG